MVVRCNLEVSPLRHVCSFCNYEMFRTWPLGRYTTYLHTKFHIPSLNNSLVMEIFVFCVLQD